MKEVRESFGSQTRHDGRRIHGSPGEDLSSRSNSRAHLRPVFAGEACLASSPIARISGRGSPTVDFDRKTRSSRVLVVALIVSHSFCPKTVPLVFLRNYARSSPRWHLLHGFPLRFPRAFVHGQGSEKRRKRRKNTSASRRAINLRSHGSALRKTLTHPRFNHRSVMYVASVPVLRVSGASHDFEIEGSRKSTGVNEDVGGGVPFAERVIAKSMDRRAERSGIADRRQLRTLVCRRGAWRIAARVGPGASHLRTRHTGPTSLPLA